MINWLIIKENIALLITLSLCIGAILAHSLGLTEDIMSSNIALMILSSFIIYDSIEKRKIRNELKTIKKSINGASVKVISDRRSLYSYLSIRVKEAERSWHIFTFSGYNKDIKIWPEKRAYQQAMLNSVKNNLVVRRNLAICNEDHLNHLTERMKDYRGKNYSVAGFLQKEQGVPMLNIIIIDNEEAILWLMQEPGIVSLGTGGCISIKHPDVGEKFNQYYSEAWHHSTVLKDETLMYANAIEGLRAKL